MADCHRVWRRSLKDSVFYGLTGRTWPPPVFSDMCRLILEESDVQMLSSLGSFLRRSMVFSILT
jgi:hypothetical protein